MVMAAPMSPMIITAAAFGSVSVSGMGTAGGFGASGFAADRLTPAATSSRLPANLMYGAGGLPGAA